MAARKFKSGQHVTVAQNNRIGDLRSGSFTVIQLLPEERGMWQYRVRSTKDGHERMVYESDLA
jgi:hypothetical protein